MIPRNTRVRVTIGDRQITGTVRGTFNDKGNLKISGPPPYYVIEPDEGCDTVWTSEENVEIIETKT